MAIPLVSASKLQGREVRNPHGERLGRVEDLMMDLDSGCIAYAVLSFGGVLGIGDKWFAIPWQALRADPGRDDIVVDIDRDVLAKAPGFDKANPPDMSDRDWGLEIYAYYQQDPYWLK